MKASLGNYVWEDVDADGVQDANEKGLSGIVVTLYDGLNNIVAYAVTNSVGGYNFVNLEPGDYKVHFSNIPLAGVFSPKDAAGDDTIDSDVDPATGFTAITNLVASEYDPTLDAGVHLPTGAGLGNYVWLDNSTWNIIGIDSVSGNGMQDANEIGVAGVTVTLYDNAGNAIKSTITTQSGAYSFNDLLLAKDPRDKEQVYSLFNLLDWCHSQGIKALDPTGYFFPTYPELPSDEYLEKLKTRAAELDIIISGTGIRNNFASPDPKVRAEGVELAKKWIVVASKLNAPVLRCFAGEVPKEYADKWEEVADWAIESYKELIPFAKQYNVKIGIQNHGDMLQTAEQCLYVLKVVNSEWAGIIVDTGNFTTADPY